MISNEQEVKTEMVNSKEYKIGISRKKYCTEFIFRNVDSFI